MTEKDHLKLLYIYRLVYSTAKTKPFIGTFSLDLLCDFILHPQPISHDKQNGFWITRTKMIKLLYEMCIKW